MAKAKSKHERALLKHKKAQEKANKTIAKLRWIADRHDLTSQQHEEWRKAHAILSRPAPQKKLTEKEQLQKQIKDLEGKVSYEQSLNTQLKQERQDYQRRVQQAADEAQNTTQKLNMAKEEVARMMRIIECFTSIQIVSPGHESRHAGSSNSSTATIRRG